MYPFLSNLTLTSGLPISGQGATSGTGTGNGAATSSSQKLGTITMQQNSLQTTVNISEVDAPKISPDQKVTIILDAFPDKTFTGKVLTLDTNGVVSSGVTNYPAIIGLDNASKNIYPNMAVNANIIVSVKNDVVLVPSGAISVNNGQSVVRVLRNGNPVDLPVEVGDSNDTQTEIKSGISEGDNVITVTVSQGSSIQNKSPFAVTGFGGSFRPGGSSRSTGR